MNPTTKTTHRNSLSRIRTWWIEHQNTALGLSIGFMGIISILRWRYELHRLLFEDGPKGAIDLGQRFCEVSYWFAGSAVYGKISTATYPPASYVILWPFLGWLDFTPARWLWAFTMVGALTWLIIIVIRESFSEKFLERLFLILLVLSMYSTCVTIGNGQLVLHILPMLLGGLLMLHRSRKIWSTDLITSLLILFCLVKPSITIPFFWILLCKRKRVRAAIMIVVMYSCLTLIAVSFQEAGFFTLMKKWLLTAKQAGVNATYGYANLHQWMNSMGLEEWVTHASLLVLVLLGWWLYYNRNKDLWPLLGVTAIVSRIWTYHALYDDILILIPMIALFRIAKQESFREGDDVKSGVLLAVGCFSMLSPARLLTFPSPWDLMFKTAQTIVWLTMLIFLVRHISMIPQFYTKKGRELSLP